MLGLARIFLPLASLGRAVGACAMVGVMVGLISGGSLSLLDYVENGIAPTPRELFYLALILAGFSWVIMLFILSILSRLKLSDVWAPALWNAVLVTFATAYLAEQLGQFGLAWVLGVIVGLFFGYVLCTVFARLRG